MYSMEKTPQGYNPHPEQHSSPDLLSRHEHSGQFKSSESVYDECGNLEVSYINLYLKIKGKRFE